MATSKDYNLRYALEMSGQIQAGSADLYGGSSYPVTGAGDQVRLETAEIDDVPEQYIDESTNGSMYDNNEEVVAVLPKFSLTSKFWGMGINKLLLACFGYEDLSAPDVYDTTKYAHLYSLDADGQDQRVYTAAEIVLASANADFSPAYATGDYINRDFSLAIEQGPGDVKAHNCRVKEFSIKANSKEPVMIEASGNGEIIVRDTGKSESANWTQAASAFDGAFFLRHCTAKFGALGGLAAVSLFNFEVKISHGQADEQITTGTSNSGKSRSEPPSTGKTAVEVSFQVNKHDANTSKTLEQAGTVCAMSLDFTRGTDRMIILLPHLQVDEAKEEITDGSLINMKCKGFLPTGTDPFTTERSISGSAQTLLYTTPVYLVLGNKDDANALRAG